MEKNPYFLLRMNDILEQQRKSGSCECSQTKETSLLNSERNDWSKNTDSNAH